MLKLVNNFRKNIKVSGHDILLETKNGKLFIAGKLFFSDLRIKTEGRIIHYFDKEGELDSQINTKITDFVQTLFRDKLLKFRGDNVVQNLQ